MTNTRRTFLKSVGAIGSLALPRELSSASTSEPDQERKLPTLGSPTAIRCVVTGQMKSGKSVIVSQTPVPPVTVALMPGYEFYPLWGNDDHPSLPSDGTPTEHATWFPPKHGFRFAMFTVPPATTRQNWACSHFRRSGRSTAETARHLEVLEIDHPGMHTTDSVDFDVVVFENRLTWGGVHCSFTLLTHNNLAIPCGPQCGKTCPAHVGYLEVARLPAGCEHRSWKRCRTQTPRQLPLGGAWPR